MLLPQPSSPLILGKSFLVEVPYNEGRFRFSSKVREDYVAEPDPVGRYYATFSIPKDILVYNQRSSYRVSYSSPTIMEVFGFDEREKARIAASVCEPLCRRRLRSAVVCHAVGEWRARRTGIVVLDIW